MSKRQTAMNIPSFQFSLLVAVVLLLSSSFALAEWTKAGKTIEATVFYDAKSIQRNKGRAKMWVLTNFSKPIEIEGKMHLSSKARFEYDCAGEKSRVDGSYFYALPDGNGEVTGAEPKSDQWYPITPQTIAVPLWKAACGR